MWQDHKHGAVCRKGLIYYSRPETASKSGPLPASGNLALTVSPVPRKLMRLAQLCLDCYEKQCGLCCIPGFLLGVWTFGAH